MYDMFLLFAQAVQPVDVIDKVAGPVFDSLNVLFQHVAWRVFGLFVLVLAIRLVSLYVIKKIRERA